MIDRPIFDETVSGDPESLVAIVRQIMPGGILSSVTHMRGSERYEIAFFSKTPNTLPAVTSGNLCESSELTPNENPLNWDAPEGLQEAFGHVAVRLKSKTLDTCLVQIAYDSEAPDPKPRASAQEVMEETRENFLRELRRPRLPTTPTTDPTSTTNAAQATDATQTQAKWCGNGKPPETKMDKIKAIQAWDAIGLDERPRLEDWLIKNFGTDPATEAQFVPESTFHGWRKLIPKS